MGKGIRATMERFHTLLTNQLVGNRPLTAALARSLDHTLRGEQIKDDATTQYLLEWVGGGAYQDIITGPIVSRTKTFRLTLSHRLGTGHRAGQDVQETIMDLADLWEQVHFRLEDINNLDRQNTGCLYTFGFSPGTPTAVGHRMQLIGTFQGWIDTDVGAL